MFDVKIYRDQQTWRSVVNGILGINSMLFFDPFDRDLELFPSATPAGHNTRKKKKKKKTAMQVRISCRKLDLTCLFICPISSKHEQIQRFKPILVYCAFSLVKFVLSSWFVFFSHLLAPSFSSSSSSFLPIPLSMLSTGRLSLISFDQHMTDAHGRPGHSCSKSFPSLFFSLSSSDLRFSPSFSVADGDLFTSYYAANYVYLLNYLATILSKSYI